MYTIFKTVTATAAVLALGTVFMPSANACVSMSPKAAAPAFKGMLRGNSQIVQAAYYKEKEENNPIVGLWKVVFTSKGSVGIPDGTLIDTAYATWHNDGTEIMNSGKPPITSSFCMGVWTATGTYTYVLNHYALAWDTTGAVFQGPTNIKESITLDYSGTAFSGTFTIINYDTQGKVSSTINGTLAGTRLTVDSQ
jgi:hypothetical protein